MKAGSAIKNAAQIITDPFETLSSQIAKPMLEETASELGSFFGAPKKLGANPKALAQEDLKYARDKQKLEEMEKKSDQTSKEKILQLAAVMQNEYRAFETKGKKEQQQLREEVVELQSEVVKLAKASGVDTKAHMERIPEKVSILDIKRLTFIIKFLRMKTEESKSAQELVFQRSNAKRTTGMLAWVSGKQMKVHEQGTLQLQG